MFRTCKSHLFSVPGEMECKSATLQQVQVQTATDSAFDKGKKPLKSCPEILP